MELNELRKVAEAATPGPWQWGPERSHWGDCGPNLETVERGPLYEDGSQGAAAEVVGSWGHDANGISVEDHDKAFIATFDPPTVLALITELETFRRRLDAMRRQRDGYRNQLRKAEQQIQRVRELHERIPVAVNGRWEIDHCKFCYEQDFSSNDAVWPCPTIRALDGDGRG